MRSEKLRSWSSSHWCKKENSPSDLSLSLSLSLCLCLFVSVWSDTCTQMEACQALVESWELSMKWNQSVLERRLSLLWLSYKSDEQLLLLLLGGSECTKWVVEKILVGWWWRSVRQLLRFILEKVGLIFPLLNIIIILFSKFKKIWNKIMK